MTGVAYSDPVSIILISSGSRGQRLLFRYPFNDAAINKLENISPALETSANEVAAVSRYKVNKGKDCVIGKSPTASIFENKKLFGYEDALLATILAPKHNLCNKDFELKIGHVTFVGFPVLTSLDEPDGFDGCVVRDESEMVQDAFIKMIHIVIAFESSVVDLKTLANYQTVSKMFGVALRHEEQRCRYLSEQRDIMVSHIDVEGSRPQDPILQDTLEAILAKSSLAQVLVSVFNAMIDTGIVKVLVNGWLNLNFAFPHKVHRMAAKHMVIDPSNFANYISKIKPYHTFLLSGSKEKETLINSMPHDASPAMARLVGMYNPMKSFQVLSQDADIALPQVFQIVAHLVYWGKCNVIYPLAESNVYVLSEHAHTEIDCKFAESFVKEFPQKSLLSIVSMFSFPTTLGEFCNPLGSKQQQQEQVQIVTWLLKRRFLKQLHTYVYFMPAITVHNEFSGQTESMSFEELAMFTPMEMKIFRAFSHAEQASVLQMVNQVEKQDLSMFLRMSKYMRGDHHLEEIMHLENVRRSDLTTLIDKFRSLLITAQHEDEATSRLL